MVRKGIAVWILGGLTFIAGLHALDAFLWLTESQEKSQFLALYPFTKFFDAVNPAVYLLCSIGAVFVLWGGTAVVALRNPIEVFLGKVLEDGNKENQADVELLEARTSVLEMMSATLEENSKLLSGLRDTIFNVRSEVLSFKPMKEGVEELRSDVEGLRKIVKRLEREVKKYKLCPACGRDILAEFRLCPYCGENLLKPAVDSGSVMLAAIPMAKEKKD